MDLGEGKQPEILGGNDENGDTHSIAYSQNGKYVAAGYADCLVRLWDAQGGKLLATLWGQTDIVKSMCFSPDGSYIVSAGDDTIRLWDMRSLIGEKRYQPPAFIYNVTFSPDSTEIATAGPGNDIVLFDPNSGREIRVLKGHEGVPNGVIYSPDGEYLISGDNAGWVDKGF